MKNRSDAISVRVSREAKAELQRIADAERRTLSQLVAIVIDDYLKKRAGKKGITAAKQRGGRNCLINGQVDFELEAWLCFLAGARFCPVLNYLFSWCLRNIFMVAPSLFLCYLSGAP